MRPHSPIFCPNAHCRHSPAAQSCVIGASGNARQTQNPIVWCQTARSPSASAALRGPPERADADLVPNATVVQPVRSPRAPAPLIRSRSFAEPPHGHDFPSRPASVRQLPAPVPSWFDEADSRQRSCAMRSHSRKYRKRTGSRPALGEALMNGHHHRLIRRRIGSTTSGARAKRQAARPCIQQGRPDSLASREPGSWQRRHGPVSQSIHQNPRLVVEREP